MPYFDKPWRIRSQVAKTFRRWALVCVGVIAATLTNSPVFAQSVNEPDPDNIVITPESVNPTTGILAIDYKDFVMGDDNDPLKINFIRSNRNFDGNYTTSVDPFGEGWSHSYIIGAYYFADAQVGTLRDLTVILSNKQLNFYASLINGNWSYDNANPDGAQMESVVVSGVTNAVLTTSDGYKYYFPHDPDHSVYTDRGILGSPNGMSSIIASMVDKIEAPNGEVLRFFYENTQSPLGSIRLKAIRNSRGYGILFYYLNSATGGNKDPSKQLITKIVLMDKVCATFPIGCSESGSRTLNYTYQNDALRPNQYKLTSSADVLGNVTRYGYDFSSMLPGDSSYLRYHLTEIYQPQDTITPSFKITYSNWNLYPVHKAVSSITVGQVRYDYTYDNICGWNIGTTRKDPLGGTTRFTYSTVSSPEEGRCIPANGGAVTKIVDPLMRQMTFDYDYLLLKRYDSLLHRKTNPEGDYEVYEWDDRGNKTKTTKVAKPGSGLSDITESASFPTCTSTNRRTCNKPTYTIDARGARTDYEWSDVHGQPLRILGPADSAGVRPEKVFSYTAFVGAEGNTFYLKSAEVVKNDSVDTTTLNYQYDQNNVFRVIGEQVTSSSGSRRTCFSYDGYGSLQSKTEARANLAGCQ